mmetsp:Transcript_49576/g.160253  ORF Transcript_49576/g.160253 Transcript_49576/m.160253 type:complete len:207 (+) Transcript_49576:695-1315(+)
MQRRAEDLGVGLHDVHLVASGAADVVGVAVMVRASAGVGIRLHGSEVEGHVATTAGAAEVDGELHGLPQQRHHQVHVGVEDARGAPLREVSAAAQIGGDDALRDLHGRRGGTGIRLGVDHHVDLLHALHIRHPGALRRPRLRVRRRRGRRGRHGGHGRGGRRMRHGRWWRRNVRGHRRELTQHRHLNLLVVSVGQAHALCRVCLIR